jgi:hypothetical protein
MEWCKDHGKDYLPVVFRCFRWHNMRLNSALDEIPRLKGRFLWKQFVEAKKAVATMIYQAMFDEMDEGTAIFKCTNDPPIGASRSLTLEGMPSDHYLWLAGMGGQVIRGQVEAIEEMPVRNKDRKPQVVLGRPGAGIETAARPPAETACQGIEGPPPI